MVATGRLATSPVLDFPRLSNLWSHLARYCSLNDRE
ncbi:hypothetical protein A2U01_0020350 [Trifolium medium]|uniref:Uncharacterized protein n=1 Tax=Trifolium medium TaxID=97028 RepID=A0A392NJQ1_9FABA|nr:hypothetical protein [Trifolium medium]